MADYQLTIHTPGETAVRCITADPDCLTQEIHRHARGVLGAQRVDIRMDADGESGSVVRSGVVIGTFTLSLRASEPDVPRQPLHGYTAADIDSITRTTISVDRWRAGDVDERAAAIRFAIIEYLCVTTETPTRRELVSVGTRASDRHVVREMHHHGWDIDNIAAGPGAMTGFQRYWQGGPPPSPEHIINRQAREQIWPLLTARQQQALEALGDTGDYAQAAAALGIADATFRVLISSGRRRFLTWWHEGETPSRLWRTDRHLYSRDGVWRGTRRLTVSDVEGLRDRYHQKDGPTLAVLAAEAGVHKSTLSALLSGRTRPAPDQAGEAA